ncbi:uncharacterized protein K441DRAFT_673409 [Cenococcum geophilum 1.58]|uniref:uncharacterized protein n=1 Tax=Cenococcum geophilum 1.58 TaxID=794803 RepID=UPI00358F4893|nr:hypothetical protein K441DRAFT_673409 [Cenococcum geophilum 1.58]
MLTFQEFSSSSTIPDLPWDFRERKYQVAAMIPATSGRPTPSPIPIPTPILLDDPAEVGWDDDVPVDDVLVPIAVPVVAPPTPAVIVVPVAVLALLGTFVKTKAEVVLELGLADEVGFELELGLELELELELAEDVGESLIFWLSSQQFWVFEVQHQVPLGHWVKVPLALSVASASN